MQPLTEWSGAGTGDLPILAAASQQKFFFKITFFHLLLIHPDLNREIIRNAVLILNFSFYTCPPFRAKCYVGVGL